MVTDEPLSVSTVREQLRVRCSNWARVITSAKHWRIGAWIPGAPLTSQRPPATLLRADGTVAAKAATGRAIAAPRISGPLMPPLLPRAGYRQKMKCSESDSYELSSFGSMAKLDEQK